MHDKTNDEDTKRQFKEDINTYFDLSSLELEDLDKKISELNFDEEEK
jgi:hypothetical protein